MPDFTEQVSDRPASASFQFNSVDQEKAQALSPPKPEIDLQNCAPSYGWFHLLDVKGNLFDRPEYTASIYCDPSHNHKLRYVLTHSLKNDFVILEEENAPAEINSMAWSYAEILIRLLPNLKRSNLH